MRVQHYDTEAESSTFFMCEDIEVGSITLYSFFTIQVEILIFLCKTIHRLRVLLSFCMNFSLVKCPFLSRELHVKIHKKDELINCQAKNEKLTFIPPNLYTK